MSSPAVQRDTSARSDVALYALLELSKALSSEFNLDKLLAVIVEKASAVVEAESTRIVLEADGADSNLTNTGTVLRRIQLNPHRDYQDYIGLVIDEQASRAFIAAYQDVVVLDTQVGK